MKRYDEIVKNLQYIFPYLNRLPIYDICDHWDKDILNAILTNKEMVIDVITTLQHLPPPEELSETKLPEHKQREKIVSVVFDIRSSQHLLDTLKPNQFFEFLISFVLTAKEKLFSKEYKGIYDKFTGDGLIVHFSKNMSGNTFADKAIKYSKEVIGTSVNILNEIFTQMSINYSKDVGVCAGIDYGEIMWLRNGVELTPVGQSIVYAHRLCSEASKGEILVNNLAYNKITKGIFNFNDKDIKPKGFKKRFKVYKLCS